MSQNYWEIACPCCHAQLRVERRTGKVLEPTEGGPKDLSEVVRQVEGRADKLGGQFDAALDAERRRQSELEDLFRKATDRARKEGPQAPPPDADRWR